MGLGEMAAAALGAWAWRKLTSNEPAQRSPTLGDASLGAPTAMTATVSSLSGRVALIHQAIRVGRRDPEIIVLARQILSVKCGDGLCIGHKDYRTQIRYLYDWHIHNIAYVHDALGIDVYAAAHRTLLDARAGDCDCQVISFGALVGSVGFAYATRACLLGDGSGHILGLVGLPPEQPEGWMGADTTEPQRGLGWTPPLAALTYCNDEIVAT